MDRYIFYKGLDSPGFDIAKGDPEELYKVVNNKNFNEAAYNTLGFIKNKVGRIFPLNDCKETDGLYIKNVIDSYPMMVVNLDRRPDRWMDCSEKLNKAGLKLFGRFSAVDGTKLRLTNYIKHLFRNNDFNYRKGVVGCALSHIELWKTLVNSKNDYMIILEDDIELVDNFKEKLNLTMIYLEQNPHIDVIMLGHHLWSHQKRSKSEEHPIISKIHFDDYMGGTFGYIISKAGACKYLQIIRFFGVQNGIDRFMHYQFGKMEVVVCEPHIILSDFECNNGVDSDIQRDFSSLDKEVVPNVSARLIGGLGNQLFQIAASYAVGKDNDMTIEYNTRRNRPDDRPHYWNTLLSHLNSEDVQDGSYFFYRELTFGYKKITLPKRQNTMLVGYFQSEKYFENYKEEIHELFKLPEGIRNDAVEYVSSIVTNDRPKVCIHIRRGDYVGSDLHYVTPIEYFIEAKKLIQEKLGEVNYLYFTDDKEWVRETFGMDEFNLIVSRDTDYQEFAVMRQCDHFIITNSTFSWWAAYLGGSQGSGSVDIPKGSEKVVIAPKTWFVDDKLDSSNICPESWIRI